MQLSILNMYRYYICMSHDLDWIDCYHDLVLKYYFNKDNLHVKNERISE